jgi:hypothetical protein
VSKISFKLWVTCLLEYEGGKVTVLKSFTKPAIDSDAKFKKKIKEKEIEIVNSGKEVDLFEGLEE